MITNYPLDGIRAHEINILPDERGFFAEGLRKDWEDFIPEEVLQANISFTYPGIVRAWHRHTRGQVDYFLVLKGASKICAYNEKKTQPCRDHRQRNKAHAHTHPRPLLSWVQSYR